MNGAVKTDAAQVKAPARERLPFRPLAGVKVLAIATPSRILEACRATPDNFALRVLSGALSADDLHGATTPKQLEERFRSHEGATEGVAIHLFVTHDELALWEFDPAETILGYYPETLSDLPNVQHNQGKFGATIVDFRIFRDDIEAGVAMLASYAPSLGEIVAVAPRQVFSRFDARTRPGLRTDASRTVPVRMLDGLALIFAQEGRSADQRYAADNEKAAWCEALDLVTLSGRLALTTRSQRVSGVAGAALRVHYRLTRASGLYRRASARIMNASVWKHAAERFARAAEYARWRYFRR
ncbi:MAG: hypothetical protein AB7T59_15065 [Hyphomonadaceae bacterium]